MVRAGTTLLATTIAAAVIAVVPAGIAAASTSPDMDVKLVTIDESINDSLTSEPFSTSAPDELLVAMFSSDGPNDSSVPPQMIEEVTGCGLVWQQFAQANGVAGVAAVYTAFATQPVTDCQVTGTLRYGSDGMIAIMSFTGADPILGTPQVYSSYDSSGFGAVNVARDGSLVWQVGHNWNIPAQPVPAGSDTGAPPEPTPASLAGVYVSPLGDTSWVMRLDEPQKATPPGTDQYADIVAFFPERGLINVISFTIQPAL